MPYNDLDQLGLDYCSGNQAPDLVASVTSVGDAGPLYVGESFTINAEVYNQGTGPAASTTPALLPLHRLDDFHQRCPDRHRPRGPCARIRDQG